MTQSKRYEIAPKHLTFVQQHYTIMDGKDDISNVIREKKAARVTWVGFFTNLILSAAKIIAGIWGRSSAMIADGDRKSTRLNSSHRSLSRMPSSA